MSINKFLEEIRKDVEEGKVKFFLKNNIEIRTVGELNCCPICYIANKRSNNKDIKFIENVLMANSLYVKLNYSDRSVIVEAADTGINSLYRQKLLKVCKLND